MQRMLRLFIHPNLRSCWLDVGFVWAFAFFFFFNVPDAFKFEWHSGISEERWDNRWQPIVFTGGWVVSRFCKAASEWQLSNHSSVHRLVSRPVISLSGVHACPVFICLLIPMLLVHCTLFKRSTSGKILIQTTLSLKPLMQLYIVAMTV